MPHNSHDDCTFEEVMDEVQEFLDLLQMNAEDSLLREKFRWARGELRGDGLCFDPEEIQYESEDES